MSNSVFLASVHILTALVQFILAMITYLSNRKSTANRGIAGLLFLFGVISTAVGGIMITLTASQFIPWAVIQSISVYTIGPALLTTSILVLRPELFQKSLVRYSLLALLMFPTLVVLFDITGISDNLLGTHLLLSIDYIRGIYTGGYLHTDIYQTGIIYPAMVFLLIWTSIISILYPCLYVFFAERKKDPANSRFALILLLASVTATIFSSILRSTLPPTIGSLISNIAFATGFVYIGLQRSDERITISGLSNVIQNFPIYSKLLITTVGVVLPSILFIGFTTFSFFQSTIVQLTGDELQTISLTEGGLIANIIESEIGELTDLASNIDIQVLLANRSAGYLSFSQEEIAAQLEERNTAWLMTDENLINNVTSFFNNRTLREFIAEKEDDYSMLFLTDQYGALVTSTEFTEYYDQSRFNWWKHIDETGTAYVGSPAWDETERATYILIGVPVYSNQGDQTIRGTLLGRYNLNKVLAHLERASSQTRSFEIFNERGQWVPLQDPTQFEQILVDWRLLKSDPTRNWQILRFLGEDSLVAWSTITTAEEYPSNLRWDVLALSPYQEALSSLVTARSATLVVVVAILIGSSLIAIYFSRLLTSPLITLSQAAERILAGERNVRAEIEGQDEVATLASTFNRMTAELNATVENLENIVAERTQALQKRAFQMETSAEVAREAAEIHDLNELLDRVVALIPERFGYYHAGIFLVDERKEYAILQAANSEGGQRMLARGHKLQVGKVGVVGFTAGVGEPRIAQDVGADVVYYDNPDMPNTRSEMALPLQVRGNVIGVLDVQSTEPNAFQREDVEALQLMTDQIALAIENTRLLQGSQRALQELERIYGQQVGQAWKQKLRGHEITYRYDPVGVRQEGSGDFPSDDQMNGGKKLTREITFRGQVIGEIDLVREAGHESWSEDEHGLVEDILEQTALALENARLVDQIRLRSDQIQLLQEITAMAASLMDESQLLEFVVKKLHSDLNLLHCGAIMLDDTQSLGTLVASASNLSKPNQPMTNMVIALQTGGITTEAIAEKKTLIYRNLHSDPRAQVFLRAFNAPGTELTIVLPLIARGDVIGMLFLDTDDPDREIDDEDMNLFEQIRTQISTALDSSRLFQAEQRGRQAAGALLEITQIASSSLDLNQVLTEITHLSAAAVQANRCTIFTINKSGTLTPLISQFSDGRVIGIDQWEILKENSITAFSGPDAKNFINSLREPLTIKDPLNFDRLPLDWVALFGIKKLMLVPLVSKNKTIGLMMFDLIHAKDQFTNEQTELAQTVSGQIATTIDNANLFDETARRAERERLVAEITTKIRASNDPKIILQTAIKELRLALSGSKLKPILTTESQTTNNQPTPQGSNGHEDHESDITEG